MNKYFWQRCAEARTLVQCHTISHHYEHLSNHFSQPLTLYYENNVKQKVPKGNYLLQISVTVKITLEKSNMFKIQVYEAD